MNGYSLLDQISLRFIAGFIYDGGLFPNVIVALSAAAAFYMLSRSGDWAEAITSRNDRRLMWAFYCLFTVLGGTLIATAVFYLWVGLGDMPLVENAILYAFLSLVAYPGFFLFLLVRSLRQPLNLQRLKVAMPLLAGLWIVTLAVPAYRFAMMVYQVE